MRKRKKRQPRRSTLSVDFEGKTYEATYFVESGVVTLESFYGRLSAQVGANADLTAGMLFHELLDGAKARGKL
jgi:hypothetical protein